MAFHKGDRVCVSVISISYGRKYIGRWGIIDNIHSFEDTGIRYAVKLDNLRNESNYNGCFWFYGYELSSTSVSRATLNSSAALREKIGIPHLYLPKIKKVIFNPPATIIFWQDDTKTVVKAVNEPYDPEKGLAMAISKKAFGNNQSYYGIFERNLKNLNK